MFSAGFAVLSVFLYVVGAVVALAAVALAVYVGVLFALKAHTRWVDRGKP